MFCELLCAVYKGEGVASALRELPSPGWTEECGQSPEWAQRVIEEALHSGLESYCSSPEQILYVSHLAAGLRENHAAPK